jgi:mRNA interferase MazF
MKRGLLYWAALDKRRPVLVLSPDLRNELANDVVVAPLSSTLRPLRWHVRLEKGEGGLREASMVKCESPQTVPTEWLEVRPLGRALSPTRMQQIERALLSALGILP